MSRTVTSQRSATRLRAVVPLILSALLLLTAASVEAQSDNSAQDKHLDIRSSAGDLHVGNDANAREIGLPVYPGARLRKNDKDKNSANLSIFTSAFGMKLLVANYDSEDSPEKVIAYYREQLKKYGKVIECRTEEHGGDVHVNAGKDDSNGSKHVQCEGDNTGSVVELKVGTEDNQHLVSIEPSETGNGSTFALVYVRTRGKQADI